MADYSPDEIDWIVLNHFRDSEPAGCPECGWELTVASVVVPGFGLQLRLSCHRCSRTGEWQQPQPERSWKPLHLEYFQEAFLADQPIRCPHDDCFVSHAEFENRRVQFICPFCNRRGMVMIDA